MSKKESTKSEVTKFSKEQLINSSRYRHNSDLVSALLEDNRKYSIDEVDKSIGKYMKGKVK